jgi:predicted nucleotidyltransferase
MDTGLDLVQLAEELQEVYVRLVDLQGHDRLFRHVQVLEDLNDVNFAMHTKDADAVEVLE